MPKLKWHDVWATFVASLQPQAPPDVPPPSLSGWRIDAVKPHARTWSMCVACAGRGSISHDTTDGDTTLEICSVCGGTGRLPD